MKDNGMMIVLISLMIMMSMIIIIIMMLVGMTLTKNEALYLCVYRKYIAIDLNCKRYMYLCRVVSNIDENIVNFEILSVIKTKTLLAMMRIIIMLLRWQI